MDKWVYIRENLESRIPVIMAQNPGVTEPYIRLANAADPTGNRALYTPWLVRTSLRTNKIYSHNSAVYKKIMQNYDFVSKLGLLNGLPEKDINRFNHIFKVKEFIEEQSKKELEKNNPIIANIVRLNGGDYLTPYILSTLDPSKGNPDYNIKYFNFFEKNLLNGQISKSHLIEDYPVLKDTFKKFHNLVLRGLYDSSRMRDIDLHELMYIVQNATKINAGVIPAALLRKTEFLKQSLDLKAYKISKNSPDYIKTLTEAAIGTKWCIKYASTAESYFKELTPQTNFFIILTSTENNPKYLVHYPTLQCKDVMDHKISKSVTAKQKDVEEILRSIYPSNLLEPFFESFNAFPNYHHPYFFNHLGIIAEHFSKEAKDENDFVNLMRKNSHYFLMFNDFVEILNDSESTQLRETCKKAMFSIPEYSLKQRWYDPSLRGTRI